METLKRLPTRKHIRLAPSVYEGPGAFSVTVSTAHRRRLFSNQRAVSLSLSALAETAARQGMDVLAYCLMPDHLHLLLAAKDGGNLIRFMKAFKQLSGHRYQQTFHELLWQKGYYDHVLRKEEDMRQVARYIFENPIRAGLANSLEEYPFLGGTLLAGDLKVAPTSSAGLAGDLKPALSAAEGVAPTPVIGGRNA